MTNQASEDRLRKGIIGQLSRMQLYAKVSPYSVTAADEFEIETAVDAIQSLIRTEKLKLLAEVRERVVGEFSELDSNGRYNLKVEQRTKLTKMEAEL